MIEREMGYRTAWFEKNLRKKGLVLDVGFAGEAKNGAIQHKIIRKICSDARVFGLDINFDVIRRLEFRGSVLNGDGIMMPFAANTFDQVVMSELIEHSWEPLNLIKEAYRVLKSGGGEILMTTPHVYSAEKILRYFVGKAEMGYEDHKMLFSRTSISTLLNKVGFQIKKVDFIQESRNRSS